MDVDSKPLLLLSQALETIFICVVEVELNNDPRALEALVSLEIATDELPDFSDVALEKAIAAAHRNTQIVLTLNHVCLTKKLLALRALPFLPDENRVELECLRSANEHSWNQLKLQYLGLFLRHQDNLHSSHLERIDAILVTFIEWLAEVDFFRALPMQREIFLNEFPFSNRGGGKF